ncbi:MAG TPA: serine/threonine-protein kinase [Kofleriaceae bacterium]|nr:serine/threonine-protein kinase [Kofleriaceae bacterium]
MKPGTIIAGRYEILAKLGAGGMGEVFRARHRSLDKEVALKLLVAGSADFEVRFEREAKAAARLDHPNCVRVIDYGKSGNYHFIAMDLLVGETLAAALSRGPMTIERTVHITKGLLSALDHAHSHGVLHRDLKPENVFLVGGRPVLIDFGLATLAGHTRVTGEGMCMGSPSYVAPERLIGQPADARTDLYALGVMMYEMLAGTRPFTGPTPHETMKRALQMPPRPLAALRRDIPPHLDFVIRKALVKDPKRRFATAIDMLEELAEVPLYEFEDEPEMLLERVDEASTTALVTFRKPSFFARLWSWFRYGAWRWARLATARAAPTSARLSVA